MGTLLQDLKYGARMLAKSPGFTAVAVLTLGLGTGANTALFSLIDEEVIQSLPVKDPDRLVQLKYTLPQGGMESEFSYSAFEQIRDRNSVQKLEIGSGKSKF